MTIAVSLIISSKERFKVEFAGVICTGEFTVFTVISLASLLEENQLPIPKIDWNFSFLYTFEFQKSLLGSESPFFYIFINFIFITLIGSHEDRHKEIWIISKTA